MQGTKNNIYTVSRLNGEVRQILEGQLGKIWLNGEISNFSSPSSGHWYLTLKDHSSQIRCAMFKGRNQTVSFKPINGQQVLVKGAISVYEPRGDYQLLIESMLPAGDGLLAQQFDALKMKLAAEGLFAADTKRPLPKNIQRIGVITSPTGAAMFYTYSQGVTLQSKSLSIRLRFKAKLQRRVFVRQSISPTSV